MLAPDGSSSGVVIGGPLASLQPLRWRSRPAPCISNLMCYTVRWRSRMDSVQEEVGFDGGKELWRSRCMRTGGMATASDSSPFSSDGVAVRESIA